MADKKQYIFDNPKNVQRLIRTLYVCCGILFILDFIINRHFIHPYEVLLGFYAVYGFVGCVILVIIAKWMRTFLMRDENYYDQQQVATDEKEGGEHVVQ